MLNEGAVPAVVTKQVEHGNDTPERTIHSIISLIFVLVAMTSLGWGAIEERRPTAWSDCGGSPNMTAAYDGNTGTSVNLTAIGTTVRVTKCSILTSWQAPSTTYTGTSYLKITSACAADTLAGGTAGGFCTVSYSWNAGATWTELQNHWGWGAVTDSVAIPTGQPWANIRVKVTAVGNPGGEIVTSPPAENTTAVFPPPGTNVPPGAATLTVTEVWTEGEITVPAAPSTFSAVEAANGLSVTLTWTNAATNQTSYKVQRCTGGTCTPTDFVTGLGKTATTYTDNTTVAGTMYGYKVCAVNSVGSGCSATKYVPPPAAPGTPTLVSTFDQKNVRLSWVDNATNEASYKVQRCSGSSTCSPTDYASNLQINLSTYSDTGVNAGTMYRYAVCAVNSAGTSCSDPSTAITTPGAPAAPTNYGYSKDPAGLAITHTWTHTGTTETGFHYGYCTGQDCTTWSYGTLAANMTSWRQTTAACTTYRFEVQAVNPWASSAYIGLTNITTPCAPSNVSITARQQTTTAALTWGATDATSYTVERCSGAGCNTGWTPVWTNTTATSNTDSGLTPGVVYRWRVQAKNAVGSSAWKTTADVMTLTPTHYYLPDHLGSTPVIVSSAGEIEGESVYYPYGGERVLTTYTTTNTYKFTGKERDTETGLDYFGARYYAGNMGRWTSPDWSEEPEPVPYADLVDPQTLNLYGYVRNNPMSNVDTDGHGCPVCPDVDLESVRELINQGTAQGKALIATGTAYVAGATIAAGAAVVGAFYLADTRITDAYVANKKDEASLAALESRTIVENHEKEAEAKAGGAGARKGGGGRIYDDTPENLARMAKGLAPVGRDGKPVELHSPDQTHNGQSQEMTRTDHRGAGNFKRNHTNTGQQRSQVDRNKTARDRRAHWKRVRKEKKQQ